MAKIQFGGGVSGIQGSIAGNTFSRTKAGPAARNRVKPNNPATPAQMLRRNALSRISKRWQTLTADQRRAWDALAQLSQEKGVCGNLIAMTGHQAYVKLNMQRNLMVQAVTDDVPDVQNANFKWDFWGTNAACSVSISGASAIIGLGSGAAEGDMYEIRAMGPHGAGQTKKFSQLIETSQGTLSAAEITAGELDIATDTFYSNFGVLDGTAGKKFTFGCRQYSKSVFDVPKMLTCIITA
jgi:hypothetical protein